MAAHLSTLCLYLGLPLANIMFPYLILRWRRNASKFVAEHALAAVNFQITITVAGLFTLLLAMLIPFVWVAVLAIGTANIVYIGKAADRAKSGLQCVYPLTFQWVR